MKNAVIATFAVLAISGMVHAEDSCHVLSAPEGQKLACLESKFQNKVQQLDTAIDNLGADIKNEYRSIRPNDSAQDQAEREARVQKIKLALKGAKSELKEAKAKVKAFLTSDDSAQDAAEREARKAKVEEMAGKVEAKAKKAEKAVHDFFDRD